MSKSVKVVRKLPALARQIDKWRQSGKRIALVPTMGALHAGHLGLVRLAKKKADRVVVSIFVNPTQFAANEDLSRYPRDEAGDLEKLKAAEADLVWAPDFDVMYPDGFSTHVLPGSAAEDLEGTIRPGHFQGVTTVCCKLFSQVRPDVAIFGEKDYQQLCVLSQMVRDLNLPLKLVAAPIRREKDGLALSSRNVYLTEDQRRIAPQLYARLSELAIALGDGADLASSLTSTRRKLKAAGFDAVDYVEARDAVTLGSIESMTDGPVRVLAACRLGSTRLIDNLAVPKR